MYTQKKVSCQTIMKSRPAEQYLCRHVTTDRMRYRITGKLENATTSTGKKLRLVCRSENKERKLPAHSSLQHTRQICDFEFAKHCT